MTYTDKVLKEAKNLKVDIDDMDGVIVTYPFIKQALQDQAKEIEKRIEGRLEHYAHLEHERWAKWQKYMHSLCNIQLFDGTFEETGALLIPKEKVEHWNRQINTPYSELSEKEKESDREQVIPYLDDIKSIIQDYK